MITIGKFQKVYFFGTPCMYTHYPLSYRVNGIDCKSYPMEKACQQNHYLEFGTKMAAAFLSSNSQEIGCNFNRWEFIKYYLICYYFESMIDVYDYQHCFLLSKNTFKFHVKQRNYSLIKQLKWHTLKFTNNYSTWMQIVTSWTLGKLTGVMGQAFFLRKTTNWGLLQISI
jgi:hypothetical protein